MPRGELWGQDLAEISLRLAAGALVAAWASGARSGGVPTAKLLSALSALCFKLPYMSQRRHGMCPGARGTAARVLPGLAAGLELAASRPGCLLSAITCHQPAGRAAPTWCV